MSRTVPRSVVLIGLIALTLVLVLGGRVDAYAYTDAQCIGCHGSYSAHVAVECYQCHWDWEEPGFVDYFPGIHLSPGALAPTCVGCHGPAFPTVTQHTEASVAAGHVSPTTISCFGSGCHDASKNLDTVHTRYVGAGSPNPGYTTTCALCHRNPSVNPALSDKRCTPACHSGTTHAGYSAAHTVTAASSECTDCHGTDLTGLHGAYDDTARCAWCHGQTDNWTKTADCASCHADLDHGPLHASALPESCQECHDANVAAEHTVGCAVCHDSTVSVVVAAIAGNDLSCSACHGEANHTEAHDPSPTITAECTGCHAADVVTEHLSRGLTCDDCHGATAPLASPVLFSALGASAFGDISVASEGMTNEDIWEAIAAGDTSCSACHASFHGSMLSTSITNPAAPGYLSWDAAATAPGNTGTSPHGGYTSVTNKCAVCHSVHRAVAGASVLTAYGPYATYAAGCVACHGDTATFTDVKMTADADGYISPHGTCTRCHTLNPHGAGGSVYPVLASKLLNTGGDAAIAADLAGSANGLAATMFDGTGDGATGLILGTGYLCASCHQQAFAVNTASADPASAGHQTGHRVTANATATWDADVYGGSFGRNGISGDGTKTVAFADAYGCDSCHAAPMADGSSAFPHGYVDATGAVAPKTVAGSSYVWLTAGSFTGSADTTIVATTEPDSPLLLTDDGLCLKCHRGSTDTGVGYDF